MLDPVITLVEACSGAGFGLEVLAQAVARGADLRKRVPWEHQGIRSPFAALLGERMDVYTLLERLILSVQPDEGGCGLVVATTSGAISGFFEDWYRKGAFFEEEKPWRQDPTRVMAEKYRFSPFTTVSVACASGSTAFELARGWLRVGRCSRVVVVGLDVLSLYIHAGFAGLGAMALDRSHPFAAGRDGLVLGEGGAAFLLETPASAQSAGRTPLAVLLGCGITQDAVHLTAPDRTGGGLARAAELALQDARIPLSAAGEQIDIVSAHATGTPFNDAMESRALNRVFGGEAVPIHAAKPVIGHTLGAAGAIEAALCIALLQGAPPPPRVVVADPDCPMQTRETPKNPRIALSVNAAFGGVNAALVLAHPQASVYKKPVSRKYLTESSRSSTLHTPSLTLNETHPHAPPTLGRADLYVRAGIALLHRLGPLDPLTPVVLASPSNCRAADHRYFQGLVTGGASGASRIHFTYTTPGSPMAEASILLGLKGMFHTLCDDHASAHREAIRLVQLGAPQAVALSLDAPTPSAALGTATLYTRLNNPSEPEHD